MTDLDLTDDIIDVRNIIARFEEIEESEDADEIEQRDTLASLLSERPIGGEMTVCPYGGETTATSARLIAAAPDLLGLVRELLDNAEIDALNEPELRPLVRKARDVLAELA